LSNALAPLSTHAQVTNFRHRGMIWAFDAVIDSPQAAVTFSQRFFSTALEHELLLRPIGNTVYLMPPYILSSEEIEGLASRVQTVFAKVMAA
jgi:adenosylmethionine-8-amino-7-oxononanoate aminotransferase